MANVKVANIHKSYRVGSTGTKTILESALSLFTNLAKKRALSALSDVSFDVGKGEIFGIIGRNGSGKTTLLRIIASIIQQDKGSVVARGRVVPLIRMGDGMELRLTLRENIILLCTLLGFTQKEIKQKFDAIVVYAELTDFVDTQWYKFSDGMKQRAVFSVVLHSDPDTLLLDEVFSAGDELFKKKSVQSLIELSKAGTTIIIVGHNMSTIRENCDRVLWLEKGAVRMIGETVNVVNEYTKYGG